MTAEGMRVLKAEGIVHRDLKPSNILYRTDAQAQRYVVSILCVVQVFTLLVHVPCMYECTMNINTRLGTYLNAMVYQNAIIVAYT